MLLQFNISMHRHSTTKYIELFRRISQMRFWRTSPRVSSDDRLGKRP